MSRFVVGVPLAAILLGVAYGSGDIRTVPAISALRGSTVELPCEVDRPFIAVYWYRHNSMGDPDYEIVIQNYDNQIINDGGPRFNMTPSHTLVLRNLSVADETTYSCHAALRNGDWPRGSTNLTVIVRAEPLHPTVDHCKTTSEGECTYTVGKLMEEFELFPIVCRVNMIRPAVSLSWMSVKGDTHSEEYARTEIPAEDGLWNVSLGLKVSRYEVGRKFRCLAEGIAVKGSTEMVVHLKREQDPQVIGTAAPLCECRSTNGFIAVIVVLVLFLVSLICGVLYLIRTLREARSKLKVAGPEELPQSELQAKRQQVLSYTPGARATEDQGTTVRRLPKKARLAVYGLAGAGRSSFIKSLIYSVRGEFPHIGTGKAKSGEGATFKPRFYKITPQRTVLIQDTVDLPANDKEAMSNVIDTMQKKRICCPVIVLSRNQGIAPHEGTFNKFVEDIKGKLSSTPVFVVTRQNGDEGSADDTKIKEKITAIGGVDDKIFFVDNILQETDDDKPKNAFLDILLKLLQVADDNMVHMPKHRSRWQVCGSCFIKTE
ncbi:uncharacterized protein [Diadema antillarum]|uniref:uncharacterized protein isoform X2 n=1 Tax=Diadema antillarum TaxID=105358 RepID=UPI003A8A1651